MQNTVIVGLLATLVFAMQHGCALLGVSETWCHLVAAVTWVVALALLGVVVLEAHAHRAARRRDA
jgi:hypothetical protein